MVMTLMFIFGQSAKTLNALGLRHSTHSIKDYIEEAQVGARKNNKT
jgi:hypothetical protein